MPSLLAIVGMGVADKDQIDSCVDLIKQRTVGLHRANAFAGNLGSNNRAGEQHQEQEAGRRATVWSPPLAPDWRKRTSTTRSDSLYERLVKQGAMP